MTKDTITSHKNATTRMTQARSWLRIFTRIFCVLLTLISAIWAFHLRDPHLLVLRRYETGLVLGLLVVALLLSLSFKRLLTKRSIQATSVLLLVLVASAEYRFQSHKHRLFSQPTTAEQKINQRLIVGFRDVADIEQLARNGIAGIFISQRNIVGTTFAQLQAQIDRLQQLRRDADLPPLIIATDQEGGPVSSLSPLIDRQPPLSSLATQKHAVEQAFAYGVQQGSQLHQLGITVNFSPVVDLKPTQPSDALDFHTLIQTRAIAQSPENVVEIALPYIQGLATNNVTATLKHFPGLGRISADTHHFSARLDTPVAELATSDWLPYSIITGQTDAWIMLAHIVLSDLDADNPVSTSPKAVADMRTRLGFKGVLVTDDLTMGATYNRGFCKSVRGAFAADIDYLLIAYDDEKYFDLVECLTTTAQ